MNILKEFFNLIVFIEFFNDPKEEEEIGNIMLKSKNNPKIHIAPSHSLYVEPLNHYVNIGESSDEEDKLNFNDNMDIMKRFKAYSERVRSSRDSLRKSFQGIDVFDDKSSSVYTNFLDIKDIKIKDCFQKNGEIVFFIKKINISSFRIF